MTLLSGNNHRKTAGIFCASLIVACATAGCKQKSNDDLEKVNTSQIQQHDPLSLDAGEQGTIDVPKSLTAAIKNNRVDEDIKYLASLPMPSTRQLEFLASLYLYKQDYKKAQNAYQTLSERQPANSNHLAKAGFCAMLDNRAQDGIALLKKSAQVSKFDVPVLTSLGIIFVDMSRGKEAAEIAERVAQLAPENPNALALVAHVRQGFANYPEAEKWFRRALGIKPDHYFARYYLAQVYRDSGQHEKAAQELTTLAQQYPKRGWPYAQMGYNLVVQNKLKEALPLYQKAVKVEPTDGLLWSQLGHMYMRLSNFEEAARNYKKALSIRPSIRSASSMMVPLYAIEGDDAEKLKLLNTSAYDSQEQRKAMALLVVSMSLEPRGDDKDLKQKRPDNLPFPWINDVVKAESLSLNGNFDEAEGNFKAGIAKSNDNVLARYMYAAHLLRCHREAEAVDEYKELNKLLPHNAAILSGLSLSMAKSKQFNDADAIAHESIELHPNFRAWYALGLMADAGGRKDEALFALREASRLRAFDPMLELDLSHRLNALGDETQSKATLKPLINAEPDETDVWLDVVTNFSN